jgi:hypothetical protein
MDHDGEGGGSHWTRSQARQGVQQWMPNVQEADIRRQHEEEQEMLLQSSMCVCEVVYAHI